MGADRRMCGIIGYVGGRACSEVLLQGLRRLEYRGYDSAGLAWHDGGTVQCLRSIGNLDALEAALAQIPGGAATTTQVVSAGIGHTRWATHGAVTERNAHPHDDAPAGCGSCSTASSRTTSSCASGCARDLVRFSSDTDAEVVAHLIALYYDGDLADAVRRSLDELAGHYAFVAMCDDEPDTLVGVRRECPLVVGLGDDEQFVASSIAAFLPHTRKRRCSDDGDIATLRPGGVTIAGADGRPQRAPISRGRLGRGPHVRRTASRRSCSRRSTSREPPSPRRFSTGGPRWKAAARSA